MKDYPFSFETLSNYSESVPYLNLGPEHRELYDYFKSKERELNFPAITDDIGDFLRFLFNIYKPRTVFEFGSGYGQSAFWYFLSGVNLEKVYLCEKRTDLQSVYEAAPWPEAWHSRIDYYVGDAFERFKSIEKLDFLLIDGVKADYLEFLELSYSKMNNNSFVCIDNSYWRGSFLDDSVVAQKKTAQKIKELHEYIRESKLWDACFIPYKDGVTILRPLI